MKAAAVFARVLLCLALVAGGGASALASWYSPELKQKAEQGDAKAQWELGLAYNYGNGVKSDETEGNKWLQRAVEQYRLAAEQGDAEAQYQLGYAYAYGYGVKKDGTEAVKWLRRAIDQKYVRATWQLSFLYGNHYYGVENNEAEEIKLLSLFFEQASAAAEQGDAEAQSQLGFAYNYGEGVEQNNAEAVKWYRLAAEQGNERAQNSLGNLYGDGEGVEKDFTEAVKWWRLAAEQGSLLYWHIVSAYENGEVGKDNADALTVIQIAVKKYRPAAELGDDDAQYALGHMYLNGYGVEKNETEAAKWYNLAAKQDYREAQYALGVMYEEGKGVERDEVEAFRFFLRSNYIKRLLEIFRPAAERGDGYAQYELGNLMYDDEKKLKWYRRAAEQGYVEAQGEIGLIYDIGSNGVEKEDDEAIKWYRRAAKQGHAESQNRLGVKTQDHTEAIKWFRRAAEKGNKDALRNLGFMYLNGYGVSESLSEAIKWFRQAAEHGHSGAGKILGYRYFNGDGVAQDYREAYIWYSLTYDKDKANSAKAKLTATQIKSADEEVQKINERNRKIREEKEKAEEEAALAWRRANVVPDLRRKGDAYYKGKGVLPSYKEAAKWYLQAAERGDAEAQYRLGLMYAEGKRGIEQNHVEAYIWLALAGVNDTGEIGDKAASLRESVEKSLTAEQFEQAQAEATERLEKIKAKQ